MLKANTLVGYWTHLIPPGYWELPKVDKIEAAPYPVGLFLTIEKTEDGYSLTGRSVHEVSSEVARTLYQHLFGDNDVGAATVVVSHIVLPETNGRGVLIEAIRQNRPVDWTMFHTEVLDVEKDIEGKLNPAATTIKYEPVTSLEHLQGLYEAQNGQRRSIGLLLQVEINGQKHWYRRPLEYYLVAEFTNFDVRGNLYLRYVDPISKVSYTGFFRNGEKTVINDLLKRVPDPIGRLVGITVKSMTQTEKLKVSMFGVRFEGLVNEMPDPEDQFKLV